METVTITAKSEEDVRSECKKIFGWTPDAIREVDSGEDGVRAWKCFESAADAELWDRQT